jgi:hypothetical protein
MWRGNGSRPGPANGCGGMSASQPLATICCVAPVTEVFSYCLVHSPMLTIDPFFFLHLFTSLPEKSG